MNKSNYWDFTWEHPSEQYKKLKGLVVERLHYTVELKNSFVFFPLMPQLIKTPFTKGKQHTSKEN